MTPSGRHSATRLPARARFCFPCKAEATTWDRRGREGGFRRAGIRSGSGRDRTSRARIGAAHGSGVSRPSRAAPGAMVLLSRPGAARSSSEPVLRCAGRVLRRDARTRRRRTDPSPQLDGGAQPVFEPDAPPAAGRPHVSRPFAAAERVGRHPRLGRSVPENHARSADHRCLVDHRHRRGEQSAGLRSQASTGRVGARTMDDAVVSSDRRRRPTSHLRVPRRVRARAPRRPSPRVRCSRTRLRAHRR
jgi:hypothetical protein